MPEQEEELGEKKGRQGKRCLEPVLAVYFSSTFL